MRLMRGRQLRILIGLLLCCLSPSMAVADPLDPFVAYGTFDSSPRGYLGCVGATQPDVAYCFVVTTIGDGPSAGDVDVIARKEDFSEFPETIQLPEIVRAKVPGESLSVGGTSQRPTMTFSASLPEIGSVSLSMTTQAPLARIGSGCDLHRVNYALISEQRSQASILFEQGTIDGRPVYGIIDSCDVFFVGVTSGIWRIASGL